jgi:hypothetical protein
VVGGSAGRASRLALPQTLETAARHARVAHRVLRIVSRRTHRHFTPTSASWLNMVERFFAEITTKSIRRGIFRSVAELEDAIHDYLDRHNVDPKPFVWTKTADVILDKERRALDSLEALKNGNQASESEH